MNRSFAAVLSFAFACAGFGPANAMCTNDALQAVSHVDVYIARGDTARAVSVYEAAANAALACATRQTNPSAHDAMVRSAADYYRSAADLARTSKAGDKGLERRWYAESSKLYRSLVAHKDTKAATRDELNAEATSNDDFIAGLDREASVVRDPHGAQTVPVWSSLRRFCHELTALRAGHSSDVAGSVSVAFVASGTLVTTESPRNVECPGGTAVALMKVRVEGGSLKGHEGWTLGENLQFTDLASTGMR